MEDLVLGIATTHNAGVCLLDMDGNIIASLAEERLSRHKNELGIPVRALKHLLNKINPERIKYIAVGSTYFNMSEKQLPKFLLNYEQKTRIFRNPFRLFQYYIWELTSDRIKKKAAQDIFKKKLFSKILESNGIRIKSEHIYFIDHHLAHASSAFYSSPFNDTLVITIDAFGDDKSGSVNIGCCNDIKMKYPVDAFGSAGYAYFFITTALGFVSGRHEGKITGLAAYGKPDLIGDKLNKYFFLEKDKDNLTFKNLLIKERLRVSLRHMYKWVLEYFKWVVKNKDFEHLTRKVNALMSKVTFNKLFGSKYSQEDIAAGVQYVLENNVCKFADFYIKKYNCRNLCLAGGVFANVKLNQRLFNLPKVENIFVHPGMGDEGTALGAAYYCLAQINPHFKRKPLKDVYLGPSYTEDEIEAELKKFNLKYRRVENESQLAADVARRIADGKIVGFFRGRMEYGPRALGARSVLADPRKKETHDILNERMQRSEFMPFAPVIPYEFGPLILEGKMEGSLHAAEFMTITYDIKKEWQQKIPAVVHVDGTARPQLIKREVNSLYYDIVTEFGKLTGVPVIVNTSFNMHEEPIVCSPCDAIRSYLKGCVDLMVMERFIVEGE